MSEAYFVLNVSSESQTGNIIQKYLNLVDPIEHKMEYEYININPKLINDFMLYQGAIDEILEARIRKGEVLDEYPAEILKKLFYYKGKKKIIEGKYYEAGKHFESALKYDRDPKILYYLGRSFLASKKLTLAENALKMALESDKNNPYFWVYLGDVYEAGGSLTKAVHMWETAFNINGDFELAIKRLKSKGIQIKSKIIARKIKSFIKKIFSDKGEKDEEF